MPAQALFVVERNPAVLSPFLAQAFLGAMIVPNSNFFQYAAVVVHVSVVHMDAPLPVLMPDFLPFLLMSVLGRSVSRDLAMNLYSIPVFPFLFVKSDAPQNRDQGGSCEELVEIPVGLGGRSGDRRKRDGDRCDTCDSNKT